VKFKRFEWILLGLFLLTACSGRSIRLGENASGVGVKLPPAWTPTPVPVGGGNLETAGWSPCPNAPISHLHIGDIAIIVEVSGFPGRLRQEASLDAGFVGTVEPAEVLEITEGPVCGTQWVWWQVQSLSTEIKGWIIEGNAYGTWLLPVE
jgi:hypothetical protein